MSKYKVIYYTKRILLLVPSPTLSIVTANAEYELGWFKHHHCSAFLACCKLFWEKRVGGEILGCGVFQQNVMITWLKYFCTVAGLGCNMHYNTVNVSLLLKSF